jgi:hypothetical protein
MRKNRRPIGLADFFQILCSVAMFMAFFILPWVAEVNAMGVVNGIARFPATVDAAPNLFIIPLVAGFGLALTMFGIMMPMRKRLFAWLLLPLGLAAMFYYAMFISTNTTGDLVFANLGFWLAFAASVGFIIQVILPRPRLSRPVRK